MATILLFFDSAAENFPACDHFAVVQNDDSNQIPSKLLQEDTHF